MDMTLIPVTVCAGIRLVCVADTSALVRPNIFGMLGPVISPSRIAAENPALLAATAAMPVTRDLPTPPLPLITAITFLT